MDWWFSEAVHRARSSHPNLILTLHRVSSEDRNVGTLELSPGHMPNLIPSIKKIIHNYGDNHDREIHSSGGISHT